MRMASENALIAKRATPAVASNEASPATLHCSSESRRSRNASGNTAASLQFSKTAVLQNPEWSRPIVTITPRINTSASIEKKKDVALDEVVIMEFPCH